MILCARSALVAVSVSLVAALIAAPSLAADPGVQGHRSGSALVAKKKGKAKKKCKSRKAGKRRRCRRKTAPPQSPIPVIPPAQVTAPAAPPPPGSPVLSPEVSISSDPALFPTFDPEVADYVLRCTGDPITVSANPANGASVWVDGEGPFATPVERQVPLSAGQEFTLQTERGNDLRTHHVRCLPPDFPEWDFDRLGQPSHHLYVVSPTRRLPAGVGTYVVVYDDQGVPVWWYSAPVSLADAKLLSDGRMAWARADGTGYELRALDGSLSRLVAFQGSSTDQHDLQQLGNGNFLVASYKTRDTVEDLSFCGGEPGQSVRDAEVQEIDPGGNVVWSWNSKDHIDVDEISARWCPSVLSGGHDLVHLNSIEPSGDSMIISLRRTDAVYGIDRSTGAVEWKLGGEATPESLTPVDDPSGGDPLAGQHDARILADGTLTVHDNATNAADGRAARAVRYEIDETARTATLLESIEDAEVPSTGCCGGARRSPSGSWLISWGQRSQVTELAPDGGRVFRLRFGVDPLTAPFSYRAFPVPPGLVDLAELRAGMNSMFPR